MKRYRVLAYDFDARANILSMEIKEEWEQRIKKQWEKNKDSIREGLLFEYGISDYKSKITNFIDIGPAPISLLSFHNKFYRQAREAFIVGAYYPCLTSICALGERVLNHLILTLKDDYKTTSQYKKVYRKQSFENWDLALEVLNSWDVLTGDAKDSFLKLKDIRNSSLHFNPETDSNERSIALDALRAFASILDSQFSAFGSLPWYIDGTPGVMYVRKESEQNPFVKRIVIPNCKLVGPKHKLERRNDQWLVHDEEYPLDEITDEEFKALLP